ncbi:hypothetical protein, partial [Xanthomonas oryzae]|uniref:hypothetical protein n=1 Tax=Xanthomonas oryzae TaxID=347 RepID=UPI001C52BC6C
MFEPLYAVRICAVHHQARAITQQARPKQPAPVVRHAITGITSSPLKNPQTASIARPHLRFWRAGT